MTGDFLDIKKDLPVIGVGLGLRRELAEVTLANSETIDWLEFVPENYMGLGGLAKERLAATASRFPLVSHGVNLSIGSTDELNPEYLRLLKEVLDRTDSPWWSDHLCFTSVQGTYMHDLLPLPFTREAVRHIAERIKRVQDFTERPFLIENISFYMNMPGAEMTDAQFMAEILETADCGLLLDVNNVYVNSLNHKFDPYEYLKQIPLDRTVQMHVAGHKRIGEYVIDTHGAALIEPVYELLEYVLSQTTVHGVLLERDQNFPDFDELLNEIRTIKSIAAKVQPQLKRLPQTSAQPVTANNSVAPMISLSDGQPVKGGRDLRAVSA
jgi:uncharacterized protein (UPF0276 family)